MKKKIKKLEFCGETKMKLVRN